MVPGDFVLSTHTLSFLLNVPQLGDHARTVFLQGWRPRDPTRRTLENT